MFIFDIRIVGDFFQTAGEVLIGITAIMVHWRVWKEHKIDEAVYREMKHEQGLGIVGVVFIIFGFLIRMLWYGGYL